MGFLTSLFRKNKPKHNLNDPTKIIEPVGNYDFYVPITSTDMKAALRYIDELLQLEKLPFRPLHLAHIQNGCTIIKIDKRIQSYMFFVITATLAEGIFKSRKVYGIGIKKTDNSRSFYTETGSKLYQETLGEYLTGRFENSQNFKFYGFTEDETNFNFELINTREHIKSISAILNENGLSISEVTN
ncbi:MAG: hypothetical protein JST26_07265 [Bacteroidetes bacterium]|nr:hypothetical protein [Bacteroidota bacterium]